jgi:hypothetical protein
LGGTGVTIGSFDSISIGQEVDTTSSVTFNTINSAAITSTAGITGTTGTFSGALSGASITGNMVADSFEADSGLLSNLIMTPFQVKRQISGKLATKYVSSYVGMSNAGQNVFVHGLGAEPDIITYRLKCISAQNGYSVNDIIDVVPSENREGLEEGFGSVVDATNITLRIASNGPGIYQEKNTGATSVLTATKWQVQVRAFIIA